MGTTLETIRDRQIELIQALTPSSLAGTSFRVALGQQGFRDWVEANAPNSFRRFAVQDLWEYTPPEVTNCDTEWIETSVEVLVAYPSDYRYGSNHSRDMADVMRQDYYQIDSAIGHRGRGNYSGACAVLEGTDYEELDDLVLMNLEYKVYFYRDMVAGVFTAMQNSQEQSFQYTTASSADTYTVTIPKAMADTTYVVQATISTVPSGGVMATLEASNSGRTTTQFTLNCSGNLATSTIIDIIVRDR